ncbi:MAG: RluA family pseudouridine synthase [Deltaproteobacteria bacterium]|jgi:23S rRNA-/tRNA-specific pseudouridylate synthase|nr:RluA family pseudouridine synthase [Deltaproteobacteria bacterium]
MDADGPAVLFEDKQILVVRKPAGWLSQPDGRGRPDMLNWAKDHIKERWGKPGAAYAGLCHRLDLPVGGVMALARTSKAANRISGQFRERTAGKIYLALVAGVPEGPAGEIEGRLRRDGNVTLTADGDDGVRAALSWRRLWRGELGDRPASLLEVNLLTGVKHQIRAQLAEAGFPVWGDALYGGPQGPKGTISIGLFAARLTLDHPVTRERMGFSALPSSGEWPWRLIREAGGAAVRTG